MRRLRKAFIEKETGLIEEGLIEKESFYTLSGRTGSALAWRSEGRTFASQSVQ